MSVPRSRGHEALTLEDIRIRLDLQEPYSYIENHRHGGRSCGYTTLMLLHAIKESQYKKVIIVGYLARYSRDLQIKARMMAMKAGLPLDNIMCLPISFDKLESLRGTDCEIFEDHYYPIKGL